MISESSLRIVFSKIRIRETFIPPLVLPAQAPINISVTNRVLDKAGQRSKSVVAYPVVVIMEPT